MRTSRFFLLALLMGLASIASAQSDAYHGGDWYHPDDIDWSPSTAPTSWTMDLDSNVTFTLAGTFAFTGSTFDLDPTGNYTLDLDSTKTAVTTVVDGTDSVWLLQESGIEWINLDLGTTDILTIAGTATADVTIGNSTGDVTLTGDNLTLTATDATDNVFQLVNSAGGDYIDLDLGAADILNITAGAGLDLLLGNSTGDVSILTDNGIISCTDATDNVFQIENATGNVVYLDLDLGASDAFTLGNTAGATTVTGSSVTVTPAIITGANNGTPGTNVTAVEYGDGYNHVTVLTLTGVALTPTIPADAEAAGAIIYTFPAGVYVITASHMDITSGVMDSATNAADLGLGSVIATGDVSLLSGTATFEDVLTGQTVADVSSFVDESSAIPTAGAPLLFEAGGSHVLHINVAATWNATVATATVTGTVTIYWTFLGS